MKRVAVVHEDGRVLRTYEINFGNLDREPQDHSYFKQARGNAIADKLVPESESNQITCRFVDDMGEEEASGHLAAQASILTRKGTNPAAAKRHDDTDPSRSEIPSLEPKRIAPIATKMARVVAITVAIGAIIAISIKLLLPLAGIPRDIP